MNEVLEQLKQCFDDISEEDIKKEWDNIGKSCKDVDPKIDEFLIYLNKKQEIQYGNK